MKSFGTVLVKYLWACLFVLDSFAPSLLNWIGSNWYPVADYLIPLVYVLFHKCAYLTMLLRIQSDEFSLKREIQ